jgi:hypothetical protein
MPPNALYHPFEMPRLCRVLDAKRPYLMASNRTLPPAPNVFDLLNDT